LNTYTSHTELARLAVRQKMEVEIVIEDKDEIRELIFKNISHAELDSVSQ